MNLRMALADACEGSFWFCCGLMIFWLTYCAHRGGWVGG